MAVSLVAARMRLGMWGARLLQARGFNSDQPSSHDSSSSGSIREAGGAFGKREQAEEERYFRARSKEQLSALKKHHENEIDHHVKDIKRLQKEIERHKQAIENLKKHSED